MAQRLYHTLHDVEDSSATAPTVPLLSPTSLTAPLQPLLPSTTAPPSNLTQRFISTTALIMSTSAALPVIPPFSSATGAPFQPALQSQLSSLMDQLIQQAMATVASQLAHISDSARDTPPSIS